MEFSVHGPHSLASAVPRHFWTDPESRAREIVFARRSLFAADSLRCSQYIPLRSLGHMRSLWTCIHWRLYWPSLIPTAEGTCRHRLYEPGFRTDLVILTTLPTTILTLFPYLQSAGGRRSKRRVASQCHHPEPALVLNRSFVSTRPTPVACPAPRHRAFRIQALCVSNSCT